MPMHVDNTAPRQFTNCFEFSDDDENDVEVRQAYTPPRYALYEGGPVRTGIEHVEALKAMLNAKHWVNNKAQ